VEKHKIEMGERKNGVEARKQKVRQHEKRREARREGVNCVKRGRQANFACV